MQVLVELLLPGGEHLPAEVLAPEVAGDAVHDDEADVVLLDDLVRVLQQHDLVVRGVGLGEDDLLQGLVRFEAEPGRDLHDPLGAEGVLGVDVEGPALQTPLLVGELGGDAELLADLGFAGPELPVELGDGLGLYSPAEEVVEARAPRREVADAAPELHELVAPDEGYRHRLPGGRYHLLGGDLADAGGHELADGCGGDRLDRPEADLPELRGGGGAHAGEVL